MTPRSVGETYSNTKHTTGGKGTLRPQLPAACRAAVTLPAQAERTRVVNKSGLQWLLDNHLLWLIGVLGVIAFFVSKARSE